MMAARRILPVDMVGMPSLALRISACVPLPAPGAPSMISFIPMIKAPYSRKPL